MRVRWCFLGNSGIPSRSALAVGATLATFLHLQTHRRRRARTSCHGGIETTEAKVNGLLPLEVLLPLEEQLLLQLCACFYTGVCVFARRRVRVCMQVRVKRLAVASADVIIAASASPRACRACNCCMSQRHDCVHSVFHIALHACACTHASRYLYTCACMHASRRLYTSLHVARISQCHAGVLLLHSDRRTVHACLGSALFGI